MDCTARMKLAMSGNTRRDSARTTQFSASGEMVTTGTARWCATCISISHLGGNAYGLSVVETSGGAGRKRKRQRGPGHGVIGASQTRHGVGAVRAGSDGQRAKPFNSSEARGLPGCASGSECVRTGGQQHESGSRRGCPLMTRFARSSAGCTGR